MSSEDVIILSSADVIWFIAIMGIWAYSGIEGKFNSEQWLISLMVYLGLFALTINLLDV